MTLRLWLFLISVILLFMPVSGASAKGNVEVSGDVLRILMPAGTLAYTFGIGDNAGRTQFLKSFLYSSVTTFALKSIVDKERPKGGPGSFPSGHTAMVFSSAGFVHDRYGRAPGLPMGVLATYVAWSRIRSDNHDFWDVAAGAVIGLVPAIYFTAPYSKQAVFRPVVETDKIGCVFGLTW